MFLRLAAASDVVLSNFKPGTMESLGLGYDDLVAGNPGIIVAPQAEVVAAALELADKITANAPLAVQASKRVANGTAPARAARCARLCRTSPAAGQPHRVHPRWRASS